MNNEAWDNLWRGKETQLKWSKPDEDTKALIPILKEENGGRVLDLGCGIGRHVILFAGAGFETYGIDSAASAIEHCRSWLEAEGVKGTVAHGSMDALAYKDNFFNFIVSWNVIYHSKKKDMTILLESIQRMLRKDGLFYVTLLSTCNKRYGSGIEIEPNTFDTPEKGKGHHIHHFSDENDVQELLSNWHIEQMKESEESLAGRLYPDTWHWMILARNIKKIT